MASLSFKGGRRSKVKDGRRIATIAFAALDGSGRRVKLTLGRTTVEGAEEFRRHVERLIEARITGTLAASTAEWLAGLPDRLYDKLVRHGLTEPRPGAIAKPTVTLGELVESYISKRSDVKPSTRTVWERTQAHLVEHFGHNRDIATITVGDAKDFRLHLLRKGLAEATARRTIGIAKQFFADAIDRELIAKNPFRHRDLPTATTGNRARSHFIDRQTAERIVDALPNAQWRLIFALSRYGGLRCPSEHLALRWSDVDWQAGTITVRSPKTEHHPGGESRVIPLFPELREALEDAFDPEAVHCITAYRDRNANLRTQFLRYRKKAGVRPWPRLFHNLRASRQTELTETFPQHVVARWMGNSEAVAREHYLQVTDEHFARAVGQNVGYRQPVTGNQSDSTRSANGPEQREFEEFSEVLYGCQVGDEGLEPPTSTL